MKTRTPSTTTTLSDALRRVLSAKELRMEEVVDLEPLRIDDGKRRFMVRSEEKPITIRVADQMDISLDALIRDSELGSLGLVHFVTEDADEEWLRSRIDDAAYLRHLLAEDLRPASPEGGKVPYAVEIVLVLAPSAVPADSRVEKLGDTLRGILRQGSYLHAVGINVWRAGSDGNLADSAAVRRAFSWLLTATARWYQRPLPTPTPFPDVQWKSMTLSNVRVPGVRKLVVDPAYALQIVHGHNGSGKSSLCEALELVMSGEVRRLREGHQDHAVCLTNRDARPGLSDAADATKQIALVLGGHERSWRLEPNGISDPLATLNPDSFRMDQSVADRLSQGDAADRARLFLSAFFSNESRGLRERNDALVHAKTIFEQLPERLKSALGKRSGEDRPFELDPVRAIAELQWLADETEVTWKKFIALLPLDKMQVSLLAGMLPRETIERYDKTGKASAEELDAAAEALDGVFQALAADLDHKLATGLQTVGLLREYAEHSVSGTAVETEDIESLITQWQERHALMDLFEREGQIISAIRDAQARGYEFDQRRRPLTASPTVSMTDELRQRIVDDLRRERDDLHQRVISFASSAEKAASAKQNLTPMSQLQPDVLTTAASMGLFGEPWKETRPPLGQAFREAFEQRRPVEVAAVSSVLMRVGDAGWGRVLLARAEQVLLTLDQVAKARAELPTPTRPLKSLIPSLRTLLEKSKDIRRLDNDAVAELAKLLARDGELRQALNEITALLTPARWAYSDVVPEVDLQGNAESLDLQAERIVRPDGSETAISARYVLNTAELNTLALTMFLLCARRVDNPLRVLVLDDPLQNMDELTVTTIARGLGRLLRLWQRKVPADRNPWRVLLLVHSEDDVERIRAEMPCATHLLPWLSASDSPEMREYEIEELPSLMTDELQPLRDLMTSAPR